MLKNKNKNLNLSKKNSNDDEISQNQKKEDIQIIQEALINIYLSVKIRKQEEVIKKI
jgi:hypothetical protein